MTTKRQTLRTVEIKYGPPLETMDVPAVFTAGCLAVHRRPRYPSDTQPPKREWRITHIPSGYSVSGRIIINTKPLAITLCTALAALDWSGVTPDGATPALLSRQVYAIWVAHGLLPPSGVTKDQALNATTFHFTGHGTCARTIGPLGHVTNHITVARRTGVTKTWKRAPWRFQVPVTYGPRNHDTITDQTATNWHTEEDCPLAHR